MQRYPLWKGLLLSAMLLAAVLLALPNWYGDSPALQLSRRDRSAFDDAAAAAVRGSLAGAGHAPVESYVDGDGRLWLRFDDVNRQIAARDEIQRRWTGVYAIAMTFASRAPDWLDRLGLEPMKLGLDLRGGMHLVYEVDVEGAVQQLLQSTERDFRKVLRDARIQYVDVAVQGHAVNVRLRDATQTDAAQKALADYDRSLTVTADAVSGMLTAALTEAQIKQRQDFAIQQNVTALTNRINELGVAEAVVQRQGLNRIAVQVPGVQDASEVVRLLGKVATLEFRLTDTVNSPFEAERTGRVPLGSRLYHERNGDPVLLKRDVIATGEQLIDATMVPSQGQPAVSVRLNTRGGEEMLRATKENLNRPMAVVFIERDREIIEHDGRRELVDRSKEEVISVATIRGVFSNNFEITGLAASEAVELAKLLRAGALAAPIYVVEQRVIGATLGQDNIDAGVRAMTWAAIFLFAFMIVYYRVFGVIADIVLLSNVVFIVAVLGLFDAALTLPGIAGIVLTVGTAVDANILIYERIREELKVGASPWAAINAGFDRAFSAIADSNVTMLMSAIVLGMFGSGPVRGFAVTLGIGIATSMFTALVGSRALMHLAYGRRRRIERLAI